VRPVSQSGSDLAAGLRSGVPAPAVPRATVWAITVGCVGGGAYLVMFVAAVLEANANLLQALAVTPVLILLTVPIALRIARTEGDRVLASIIMAGLVAKLLGALVRYYVAYVVYNGGTDATKYDLYARELAPTLRRGIFDVDVGREIVGTGFARLLTGIVYAIFGTSRLGGFLVFAWMGLLGLLLMWKAFRIGVPDGDGRRYLILVLFLPSLLYWPSTIGKEAWMLLGLGLTAYGIACVFQRRPMGMFALTAGVVAMALMRPHVGLVVFVALVFAMLMRRSPAYSFLAPLARIVGIGLLVVMGVFLAGRTASYLGTDTLSRESVDQELSSTEEQTEDGGSSFTPVRVRTPLDLPPAFVTVYFRPFVFEVGTPQGLATAGECMLLLGLCFVARKRLRAIPQLIRTTPYVALCLGYVITFVYAFSSFGNFGILARQRVQALPFLLALLAIPQYRPAPPRPSTEPLKLPAPRRVRRPRRASRSPA
jgi:hypothetical protein